jgi:acyl-[acyl-carrier-protein]-phospholipid O-acyltransferase / long-chain-fatty-acid--[acyl-carrier-protein] ligase
MKNQNGYGPLLADTRFEAFLWTQFLGAFNDNVYKMIVSIFAVRMAATSAAGSSRYLAIAGAVFVIPFLLFAGYAGQLADRYSKTRVLQITKSLEVVTMLMGMAALLAGRMDFLLIVLFLLATQANFFSPAKYGILPEMMSEANLSRANGLLELTTFVAIVVGTSFGTFLYERWQNQPLRMGGTLLAIAVVGTLASLHMRRIPAATVAPEKFHWNPFHEIIAGAVELREQRTMALAVAGISWFWFVGALFQMALLLAGKEIFHAAESQVGFLVTALAAGIGAGSIMAGAISGDHIELGLVPVGSALMGFFAILLGLTTSYTWALVWLAGVGFCGGLFAVPLNAYLQEHAGATEKGRILATNNFINMVGVIGASGVLWMLHDALHWNASAIILALGIVMLTGSLAVARLMPATAIRFVLWCISMMLFRIRVEGPGRVPRTGAALIVANHVSYADSVFVGLTTPRIIRFLIWRPIYEIPFAKRIFRILLAIPLEPRSPRGTIQALRSARQELLRGNLVAIFPEGEVTRTGDLNPFERGFERIVHGTGAPIIPMNIEGIYGHPLSCKGGALLRSWERVWRPRITVKIGEPIHTVLSPAELRRVVEELAEDRAASLQS